MRNHVFFMARVLDVFLQQIKIEQINHPQSTPARFVYITWANPARGRADLHPSRRILRSQFDHAVVRKDYMSAVADEKVPVNLHSGIPQRRNFLEKGDWIEHHTIADHAPATLAQDSTGDKLQHKSFPVDDDGMAGIVPSGVACYHGELLREHINNF